MARAIYALTEDQARELTVQAAAVTAEATSSAAGPASARPLAAEDARLQELDNLAIGMTTTAIVRFIKRTWSIPPAATVFSSKRPKQRAALRGRSRVLPVDHIVVQLTAAIQGQIFAADTIDDPKQLADPTRPFAAYTVGQKITAKVAQRPRRPLPQDRADGAFGCVALWRALQVIGFHRRSMEHKQLAITHRSPLAGVVVDLSVRPSELAQPNGVAGAPRPTLETVACRCAQRRGGGGAWVYSGGNPAAILLSELATIAAQGPGVPRHREIGTKLAVTAGRLRAPHANASARPSVLAHVSQTGNAHATVALSPILHGLIRPADASLLQGGFASLKEGQMIWCQVAPGAVVGVGEGRKKRVTLFFVALPSPSALLPVSEAGPWHWPSGTMEERAAGLTDATGLHVPRACCRLQRRGRRAGRRHRRRRPGQVGRPCGRPHGAPPRPCHRAVGGMRGPAGGVSPAAPAHWLRLAQASLTGRVSVAITEIADAFTDNPTAAYAVGSAVRVVIVRRDTESYVPDALACETRQCAWARWLTLPWQCVPRPPRLRQPAHRPVDAPDGAGRGVDQARQGQEEGRHAQRNGRGTPRCRRAAAARRGRGADQGVRGRRGRHGRRWLCAQPDRQGRLCDARAGRHRPRQGAAARTH